MRQVYPIQPRQLFYISRPADRRFGASVCWLIPRISLPLPHQSHKPRETACAHGSGADQRHHLLRALHRRLLRVPACYAAGVDRKQAAAHEINFRRGVAKSRRAAELRLEALLDSSAGAEHPALPPRSGHRSCHGTRRSRSAPRHSASFHATALSEPSLTNTRPGAGARQRRAWVVGRHGQKRQHATKKAGEGMAGPSVERARARQWVNDAGVAFSVRARRGPGRSFSFACLGLRRNAGGGDVGSSA